MVALAVGAQPGREVAAVLAAEPVHKTVSAEHQQQIKALTAATPSALTLAAVAAVREAQVFLVYPALIGRAATAAAAFCPQ